MGDHAMPVRPAPTACEAFAEGRNARVRGEPASANPHVDFEAGAGWAAGWHAGYGDAPPWIRRQAAMAGVPFRQDDARRPEARP